MNHKTLFPYGLNQLLFNQNIVKKSFLDYTPQLLSIYNLIKTSHHANHSKISKRFKRGSKANKHTCNSSNFLYIKTKILRLLNLYETSFNITDCKTWIFSIKKKLLNTVYNIFINLNLLSSHFSHLFFDLIVTRAHYLNRSLLPASVQPTIPPSNSYCVINFSNRIIDSLNITQLFNHLSHEFPIKNINIVKSYKYNIPFGRLIFNYNQVSKTTDPSSSTPIDKTQLCNCHSTALQPFINTHFGHVLTGNLDIITDPSLKLIMSYGTKYRLPSKNHPKSILNTLSLDLDKFIYKMSLTYSKPMEAFCVWKSKILSHVQLKLSHTHIPKSNFQISKLKQTITQMQQFLVFTYVDKAASNYAIFCKYFYIKTLLSNLNQINTFKLQKTTIHDLKRKLISKYKQFFDTHQNLNIPYLVIIPKFHKDPVKFRTVTSGHNSYATKANKKLLKVLNTLFHEISKEPHCIISNSYQLIQKMKSFNTIDSVQTLDFKDLFNNIIIKDLFSVIKQLFDLYQLNTLTKFDSSTFNNLLQFVLFHNYLVHGNAVYLQTIGVPQGSTSSSMLANIYLYFYERKSTQITHHISIFRYIDDVLLCFHAPPVSLPTLNIYPSNLELIPNEAHPSNFVNYLDITISIQNKSFKTTIYDKRNQFKFNVKFFPHYSSCLSNQVFKNLIINYLLRIQRLDSNKCTLSHINRLKNLCSMYNFPTIFVDRNISTILYHSGNTIK